jgi:hypothetical protein
MCIQVIERFSVCRCIYYRHAVDPCPARAQRHHGLAKSASQFDVEEPPLIFTLAVCKKRLFSSVTHAANIHVAEDLFNNSTTAQSARSGTGSCDVYHHAGIRTRQAASTNISGRLLGSPLQRKKLLTCGPGAKMLWSNATLTSNASASPDFLRSTRIRPESGETVPLYNLGHV